MNEKLPLTVGQQGLWYLARTSDEACAAYNLVVALRVEGQLDPTTLERALDRALVRHRTIAARVVIVDFLPWLDASANLRAPIGRFAGSLEACALAESSKPIDMTTGPLYRVTIVENDTGPQGLVLTVHHLVFDGASVALLLDEVARCHDAPAAAPAPSTSTLGHAAQSEHLFLQGDEGRSQVCSLAQALLDLPEGDALPVRRSARPRSVATAGRCTVLLGEETARGVRALAARLASTPAVVYLAALAILVWQHGRRRDIAVSLPVDTRTADTDGETGYLMNIAILRSLLDPAATIETLVDQLGDSMFALLETRHVPFPALVREFKGRRDDLAALLPRLAFKYEWTTAASWRLGDATLHPVPAAGRHAKNLLRLEVADSDAGARCDIDYDAEALDDGVVRRMSAQYARLLDEIVARPSRRVDELPVLTCEEWTLLVGGAPTAADAPPVEARVQAHARLRPDAVAVECATTRLSYGELEARAQQLAARLRAQGIGPEKRVALCMGREAERIVAMLAIAKAGGVCLPLDPDTPDERLHFMLDDSGASLIVCRQTDAARFHAARPAPLFVDAPAAQAQPSTAAVPALPGNLAYCIYTSGSTGRPKGVDIPRSALANLVQWHAAASGIGPGDRFLQVTNIAFDPATWEIWGTLCAGATLVLLETFTADPEELARRVNTQHITATCLVTPLAESFMGSASSARSPLKILHTGGDRLHAGTAGHGFALFNHYGPTECTVISTSAVVPAAVAGVPSIGRPIANVRAYVLDAQLQPLPPGVPGRLHVAGAGVARGYCGQPALTAERFLPDPFGPPGSRMYDTGDLAQWRADGQLDFMGRADRQIKWRGYRIEPGEIESALIETGALGEAVVALQSDVQGLSHLVAWIAPATAGQHIDIDALEQALRVRLPHYMVPTAWLRLEQLPKGPTGKVDRAALPEVPLLREPGRVSTASETERWLLEVWRDVLQAQGLQSTDNFFASGGHSLLATQIVAKVSSHLGRSVPLRTLLDFPTVASLAERLDSLATELPAATAPSAIPRRARTKQTAQS